MNPALKIKVFCMAVKKYTHTRSQAKRQIKKENYFSLQGKEIDLFIYICVEIDI